MSKTNIYFNGENYLVSQSEIDRVTDEITNHLTTFLVGSGANVILDGINYDIDEVKFNSAKEELIEYILTLPNGDLNIYLDSILYSVGGLDKAIEDIIAVLENMGAWELPVLNGSSLIITQAYKVIQNNNILEVQ